MKKILAVICALCVAFALGFNLSRQSVQAQTVQSASVKIGQSVEYGLQKQITHYENLLEKESSQEKRAQILRLIQTTENLLSANSARQMRSIRQFRSMKNLPTVHGV